MIVTLRLSEEDLQRVDELVSTTPLKRSQVLRQLLRLGLEQVEEDRSLLLEVA